MDSILFNYIKKKQLSLFCTCKAAACKESGAFQFSVQNKIKNELGVMKECKCTVLNTTGTGDGKARKGSQPQTNSIIELLQDG